jgi:predicted phage tail protein
LVNSDNDDGNTHGSSVSFKLEMESDGQGNWVELVNTTISGKCTARFDKAYRLDVPASFKSAGFNRLGIRMTRTSADETSSKITNNIYFGYYTAIIDNKLSYPNSALVGMQFDAEQFGSIPTRGYEIKGVKVKVPSNYTAYDQGHCSLGGKRRKDLCEDAGGTWTGTAVGTTLYSGSWNGTFTTAWTSNPAWIFYDLCTEERYGLGKWLAASQLDKWKLFEIAKYCDAVDNDGKFVGVDDGWGNKEARFTCNLYLQSAEEAYKVLNDIAAVFRGILYWQEGMIVPVQDSPKDAVMNFSDSNVIDGVFTYEGSSRKQRHNVALVTWNNPQDLYKQNVEYVEDADAILGANSQIFSKSIRALGCTSQSQARRIGKWLLYTERYETEVVTFNTGLEGAGIRPGDLIKIADSSRAGIRYGGRVAPQSTGVLIKLDSATPVISGRTYKMSLLNTEKACIRFGVKQTDSNGDPIDTQEACLNAHVDNEWMPYSWVEQRDVSAVSTTEEVSELQVTAAFTNTPTGNYMWILEEIGTVEAQDFRILSIRESEPNIHEVSALKYHGAKFNLVENNIEFSAKSTSSLPDPSEEVPEPRDLVISEELYTDSRNSIRNRATFSWKPPYTIGTAVLYPYIASYYVEWRRTAPQISNWTSIGETTSTSISIEDAPAGNLEFRVKTRRVF